MFRLVSALLLAVAPADQGLAGSPDPKSLVIPADKLSRARELVQQLGSEHYAERERAESELARMGRLARPVLAEAASTGGDPEIRYRCSRLLPKAAALDIKARIDVFLADTEGKFEHDLPGWDEFRATIGGGLILFGYELGADRSLDKMGRSVFAELLATPVNRQLVMETESSNEGLGAAVIARRQELYTQKFPRAMVVGGRVVRPTTGGEPSTADIATLLFAESLVPSRVFPRTVSITSLITASGFANAARAADDRGKVYRAIAAAWLDSRSDPVEMYQVMNVASTLGLNEHGCRIGIRLLTAPGVVGAYRGLAAGNLARLGKKEHIPMLEKALADSSIAYTIRRAVPGKPNDIESHDVQVKAMALAAAILLSGQKIEDYGFVDAFRASGAIANNTYTYSRYYIPDAQRKAVHEKWNEWHAKHP